MQVDTLVHWHLLYFEGFSRIDVKSCRSISYFMLHLEAILTQKKRKLARLTPYFLSLLVPFHTKPEIGFSGKFNIVGTLEAQPTWFAKRADRPKIYSTVVGSAHMYTLGA
jgi:hypothetical protein